MIRIKICGVTSPDDAATISEAGADAIGLNFIPSSPRCIDDRRAFEIARAIKPFTMPVGLFDLSASTSYHDFTTVIPLSVVQVYNWGTDYFFEPYFYMLCFQVKLQSDLDEVQRSMKRLKEEESDPPYAVILDSHSNSALGGTGRVAPWHLLAGFDPGVPVILAGGLTPDNVAEAIRIVRPWGVDVASGVESAPGVKDLHKVRDFIAAARGAWAAL